MDSQNIQMKISLDYITPLIWRRFIVNDSITLHRFHQIIQVIMGWTDSHLYSFNINKIEYQFPDKENDSFYKDLVFGTPPANSKKIKLSELNLKPKQKMKYIYDFGDDWAHTILIEKILEIDEGLKTPICIDGERNNPPEDCGSVPGYERILEVLQKKNRTEEDKELIEWVGEDFNPEEFDVKDKNKLLQPKKDVKQRLKLLKPDDIK